jgi:hypothetical protein
MKKIISILMLFVLLFSNINLVNSLENDVLNLWTCKNLQQKDIPTIFLPGIFASWYNSQTFDQHQIKRWIPDPVTHSYDTFFYTFTKDKGYTPRDVFYNKENNITINWNPKNSIYLFWYDWKQDNKISATRLGELITIIKKEYEKYNWCNIWTVNLVWHSMWWLVARAYLEDMCVDENELKNYHLNRKPWKIKKLKSVKCKDFTKIYNFVTIATPHRWSPLAYPLWTKWDSKSVMSSSESMIGLNAQLGSYNGKGLYQEIHWNKYAKTSYNYWHNNYYKGIVSVWQLLPDISKHTKYNKSLEYLHTVDQKYYNNKIYNYNLLSAKDDDYYKWSWQTEYRQEFYKAPKPSYPYNDFLEKLNTKKNIDKMFNNILNKYYMYYSKISQDWWNQDFVIWWKKIYNQLIYPLETYSDNKNIIFTEDIDTIDKNSFYNDSSIWSYHTIFDETAIKRGQGLYDTYSDEAIIARHNIIKQKKSSIKSFWYYYKFTSAYADSKKIYWVERKQILNKKYYINSFKDSIEICKNYSNCSKNIQFMMYFNKANELWGDKTVPTNNLRLVPNDSDSKIINKKLEQIEMKCFKTYTSSDGITMLWEETLQTKNIWETPWDLCTHSKLPIYSSISVLSKLKGNYVPLASNYRKQLLRNIWYMDYYHKEIDDYNSTKVNMDGSRTKQTIAKWISAYEAIQTRQFYLRFANEEQLELWEESNKRLKYNWDSVYSQLWKVVRYEIRSPINIIIQDEKWRKIWIDPNTWELINEIPWAYTSGDTDWSWQKEYFIIPVKNNNITHNIHSFWTWEGAYEIWVKINSNKDKKNILKTQKNNLEEKIDISKIKSNKLILSTNKLLKVTSEYIIKWTTKKNKLEWYKVKIIKNSINLKNIKSNYYTRISMDEKYKLLIEKLFTLIDKKYTKAKKLKLLKNLEIVLVNIDKTKFKNDKKMIYLLTKLVEYLR